MTQEISDTDFPNLIASSKPVLVDFWAPWCGPCRQLSPLISEIATELSEKISVVKMNIDDNQQIPSQFGVRSIPTLMIFKNGQLIATKIGSLPKSNLIEWIEDNI